MRFGRKSKPKKAAVAAYRKESREHRWVLYILAAFAVLLTVYYAFTQGALSLGSYAALLFLVMAGALIADLLHKRNLSMLKPVLAVFCISMIAGLTVGGLQQAIPPAHAYTFANGDITSSNGKITTIIPYVNPPSTAFATSLIPSIALISVGATSLTLSWFEDSVVNLGIGAVNAVIYIINLIIGATIDLIGAVVDLPVYLFDTVSVTTLGPVVDFLGLIPAGYAWFATVVVWAIAITEWSLIIVVLIQLARRAIGGTAVLLESDEQATEEDLGELA